MYIKLLSSKRASGPVVYPFDCKTMLYVIKYETNFNSNFIKYKKKKTNYNYFDEFNVDQIKTVFSPAQFFDVIRSTNRF